jgi:hypothetical protein
MPLRLLLLPFRLLALALMSLSAVAIAEKPLPPISDGAVLSGPGEFRHEGELFIQGRVTLKQMTLNLHGPIRVAAAATLVLEDVHLIVSDPEGAANGVSGLHCEGPAHIVVRHSTMAPAGTAHPMWGLQGEVEVDGFATSNSEFHLNGVKAQLNQLKIFELEISHQSQVTARGLDLVFLSTHTSEDDHVRFENIPVDKPFTQTLALGSGAHAQLADARIQIFLLYMHGHAEAQLAHIDRVQLAISPQCDGALRLRKDRLGSASAPAIIPDTKSSNCPFRISLNDVNVDTWDVYASGHSKLSFEDSQIDELIVSDYASISVHHSNVFADWLGVSADASVAIEDSTVGALSLASQRHDLATSQIRISGHGRASFSKVRFDCGIVASDNASVTITQSVTPPKYTRHSGNAIIKTD